MLDRAAEFALINIDDAVDRLKATPFRTSPALFKKLTVPKNDKYSSILSCLGDLALVVAPSGLLSFCCRRAKLLIQ